VFKSLSISIKLMIALGAMMSACGVATLVVLFSLVTLQRSDTAERSAYQISEAATLTLAAAVEQQNALRAYVATGQETARRDYLARKAAFDQAAQALETEAATLTQALRTAVPKRRVSPGTTSMCARRPRVVPAQASRSMPAQTKVCSTRNAWPGRSGTEVE
jgi:CHASE3 domain sensor protein